MGNGRKIHIINKVLNTGKEKVGSGIWNVNNGSKTLVSSIIIDGKWILNAVLFEVS